MDKPSFAFSDPTNSVIPIEVHVFERDGTFYAFDSRNYSVFALDELGAHVLSLMRDVELDGIVEQLRNAAHPDVVRAHYLRFLGLIDDGTISVEELPKPARPHFH